MSRPSWPDPGSRPFSLASPPKRAAWSSTLPDVRGASLATTFGRILDDFRSSYVLHFTPQPTGGKGFRTLRVVVKREGPFVVRARRGYVR